VSISSKSSKIPGEGDHEEQDETLQLRKVSITSTCSGSSTSSGLFVSEHRTSKPSLAFLALPISDASSEDIAEEIMDAITLVSRRCNRNRAPLRLRLSKKTLEDEEVLDALELAGRIGMAKGVEMRDVEGSVGWTVGLKGHSWMTSIYDSED
jgi:hypothetical protein